MHQLHNRQTLRIALCVIGLLAVSTVCLRSSLNAAPSAAMRAAMARKRADKLKSMPSRLPEAVRDPAAAMAFEVAPLDTTASAREAVTNAAAKIDDFLKQEWKQAGMTQGTRLDDEQFVRRVYLELGGRIPRLEEVKVFTNQRRPNKRQDLIDKLLMSPDYVSHFYNFWGDILRLKERPDKQTLVFEPYMDWVKQSIADNTPYDEWVFAMLTADGTLWDNPAVGYQLRDRGMPLPYIDNTVRVFLGVQIGCAQCHDHPFDRWTQKEFYELAALTSGTRDRHFPGSPKKPGGMGMQMMGMQAGAANARGLFQQLQEARKNREVPVAAIQFLRLNNTSVNFKQTSLKLPHDYQYDDGKPEDVVQPSVLWGKVPEEFASSDRRTQFAGWLTSQDNRQFARAIANRLWKKMMGVGLVEPVDEFQEGNIPVLPELLEHLTDEILRLDYDIREFIRIIAATEAWQTQAVVYDATSADPYLFTAPRLKRMTAEQLWDSMLTLVAKNEWAFQRPTAADIKQEAAVDMTTVNFDSFVNQWQSFNEKFGRGYQKQIYQVAGYKDQVLVRASELPTPTPANHFLSQFGMGDRDSIQSSRQAATVPQVLTMFNGWTTHTMLERGSVIYDNVVDQASADQAIETIFRSILARRPSLAEERLAKAELSSAETLAAGCGNLIWGLLNTREFMFIQ